MPHDHGSEVDAAARPVSNEIDSATTGAVVQSGTISGGVHVHPARVEWPVPRQLPAAPRQFTGRADELARLDRDLAAEAYTLGVLGDVAHDTGQPTRAIDYSSRPSPC